MAQSNCKSEQRTTHHVESAVKAEQLVQQCINSYPMKGRPMITFSHCTTLAVTYIHRAAHALCCTIRLLHLSPPKCHCRSGIIDKLGFSSIYRLFFVRKNTLLCKWQCRQKSPHAAQTEILHILHTHLVDSNRGRSCEPEVASMTPRYCQTRDCQPHGEPLTTWGCC